MIEPELARKFIEQVTQYTGYNINIMDESGVIIASRDQERVGKYHEAANRVIHSSQDVLVVREDSLFPGVLPGINMAIVCDGRKEGVVGVTGDPDQIHDVALITRMAIETMLKFEKQQESIRLRRSRKEHFLNLLTQAEYADAAEIRSIAKQLEYDESLVRVPILCKLNFAKIGKTDRSGNKAMEPDEVLAVLRQGKGHWVQDFSFVMDDNHLLVFKTVKVDGHRNLTDYREEISIYLEYTIRQLKEAGIGVVFYVGSLQTTFSRYYHAFRHCRWLESHINSSEEIIFFMDHVQEYFHSLVSRQELQQVFYIYKSRLKEDQIKQLTEMIGALEESNYNLSEASKKLYIHKNTLMYRYNKMKDYLGINPLESARDRGFMDFLYMYLIG